MDTFKLLKLKYYFMHLILGTGPILFGGGILQAIIVEMINEYDRGSRVAYVCGIVACGALILYGAFQIFQAFHYEKHILKPLSKEERKQFIDELADDVEMSIPSQAVMTKHYLLLPIRNSSFVRIFPKDYILACFQADIHKEKTATVVQMIIYDMDFKAVHVDIRGAGSSAMAGELYEKICESIPWIFHEDYDSFLAQSRKSGYRRKLVKQMEDAKMRFETGYSGDSEGEEEIQAMSEDAKERLNPDSLRQRFFSKKTK